MASVDFRFNNLEEETERIISYIDNIDFYITNKYHLTWPNLSADLLNRINEKQTNDEDKKKIKLAIKEDMDAEKFNAKFKEINTDWKNIESKFFDDAAKFLQIKPLSNYNCRFTRYGTGGSYHPPKDIVINIATCKFPVKTIAHEIIHLMIHDLIEKFEISHWEKERLVDLYIRDILSKDIMQNIKDAELIKKVDGVYEKYKSNGAESVISKI
ncbi:hypothetical protein JW977_01165 [Candidatus Falkowbacteria bacterium]|nr:hypothetical protein [Candidatus Falkowbacteria bacterium]